MFTLRKNLAQTIFRLENEAIVASRRCSNVADRDILERIAGELHDDYYNTVEFDSPDALVLFAQHSFNKFIAADSVAKAHNRGCDAIDVVLSFSDCGDKSYHFLDVEFDQDVVDDIINNSFFAEFQFAEIQAADRLLYRFEDSYDYWYSEAAAYGTINVPLLTVGRQQLRAELYRLDLQIKKKEGLVA